ncbi:MULTISPECIES: NAD(P)H-dependent oxidoreductase [Loigolactobacillus]|uniref:Flavodoxin-like fold domain-containing protein n=1 Tax=Loigolactobacillus backii TaxID=375175 RepID=A0A192H1U0_9LACO|nr:MULTISPECIES: NAD(P)H-dependent oxidoreductase [Loigolactobacillus]ANK60519.1 hypothetical protein AYR52_09815 [Loigolactobacillus backii]ANK61911.1 hypothetical protein AYR53_03485 [Loigolactobacillus backii]ANK65470.1 hypothetical protein AYR54_09615 [Loigolactobacillus backii]ANK67944.1 hypothetical protein AYR55_09745 [Loigolactobacillus backii]ANK68895.1 hypothetical protein AYR56_01240 [Loigolactobacillus backii]
MKTLIIVAHPQLADSATQAFLKAGAQLPDVTWHYLDERQSINVAAERQLLLVANRVILQFPLYWYSAPAILQIWEEQVLQVKGSLAGKELGVVVSTGVKAEAYQAGGAEQFTISELLRPFQALTHKLQMTYLQPFVLSQFAHLSESAKQRLFIAYQQYLTLSVSAAFSERESWFVERLKRMIAAKPELKDRVTLILEQLETQQEQLDELQWTLQMMKASENDDE